MRYIWGGGGVAFFYRMESLDSNHVTFTRKREARERNNSWKAVVWKMEDFFPPIVVKKTLELIHTDYKRVRVAYNISLSSHCILVTSLQSRLD